MKIDFGMVRSAFLYILILKVGYNAEVTGYAEGSKRAHRNLKTFSIRTRPF